MPDSESPKSTQASRPVGAARPAGADGSAVRFERLIRTLTVLALLYLFFLGLDLMGLSFKLFGKGFAERLLTGTSDPFVGLIVGILATSLVQSSSTTTSMTVALVAAGAISLEGAIPIIMGANIGTSVTNTLVSLGHVTRREEFRRAFAGATVHDFFNLLTVAILFPLELATGYLARTANAVEGLLEGSGGLKLFDPVKAAVRPVAETISETLGSSGWLTLLAGIALLFLALRFLVGVLKTLLTARAEQLLDRTLLRSPLAAIGAGCAITAMVQSSSITTSVMVPLVAAGIVSLEQLFPLTIGANLGTTVTAMLAALSTGNAAAISVALSHVLFNVSGAAVLYPIPLVRRIPLTLARALGSLASRHRWLALLYVALVFFGIPLTMLALAGRF
ncbi:MAG: Na/Pi symporter [Acidobacteria bacterium]|nr:Na/Pi symporter [Acidobacteriota bacterium]MCB9377482.1 Na/Pi symporter [Holophagales bacterium]